MPVRKPARKKRWKPKPIPKRITAKWLEERGACNDGVDWMRDWFPQGLSVSLASVREARGVPHGLGYVASLGAILAEQTRQGGDWVWEKCLTQTGQWNLVVWLQCSTDKQMLHFIKWCLQNLKT